MNMTPLEFTFWYLGIVAIAVTSVYWFVETRQLLRDIHNALKKRRKP